MFSWKHFSRNTVLWIIWICGLLGSCDGVTYQLSAVPEKVAIGQTLTIAAKLTGPFIEGANTDLRMTLTQPGKQSLAIFQYRAVTGCIFYLEPYTSTGTVVTCDPANSRYVIRFPSVTAAHVGLYQVSAPREIPARSADAGVTANVQLLVAPTSVTVTPSRREVVEGQATNFVCTVDDQATTPVIFVWKIIVNGNRVNPPAAATTTIAGGRGNRLSWNSVSRQHAGQYECRASNEVGAKTSQPLTHLVVYYPATSMTLTTGATTVSVGTSVMFTCTSTGGNPRPGLVIFDATSGRVWKESVQSGSATLTYGPVLMQKSTNGAKYRCKTKVNVGAGYVTVKESNILTMDVQFPPNGIKAPASVTIDEGQSKTIPCETTTSSNPKTELTWTGPAVGRSSESTSPGAHGGVNTVQSVTLTGDRTRNGATYTCTASHLGQQIYTKSTKLDVSFAPKAIAFYDTLDTPIQENQVTVFRCRAETSKPPGTIIWRKNLHGNPSVIPAGPPIEVLGDFGGTALETDITLQPSRYDNGAMYWCEVDYTYTNGTRVTRRAPAKVLEVYYRVAVGITVSQNTDNIREGDPITLTCETSGGNPQTIDKYTWTHNGNRLIDAPERTLILNPIQYDQGGKYSCSAANKGGTSSTFVDVDVKYKPRLDPSVRHQNEVAALLGDSVVFSLVVLANPEPTSVEWTDMNGNIFSTSRFLEMKDGNVYSLRINDISQQDYTTYSCLVMNTVGATNLLFSVRSSGPPETPSFFTITERSSSSLSLQWKPGFEGSSSQIFLLEVITGNEIIQQHDVSDTTQPLVKFKVENLKPATEYKFELKAMNVETYLWSGSTQISSETKSDMNELEIKIIRFDKTTVFVDWSAGDHDLFLDYQNAQVVVDLITYGSKLPSEVTTGATPRKAEARFSDRKLVIHIREDRLYTYYNVTIFDGSKLVLERGNMKAIIPRPPPKDSPMVTILISIASGLGAGCLVLAIIVTVLSCKLRRATSDATSTTRVSASAAPNHSSTGFNNRAYEDENPYMEPVHNIPEECEYSEPGEANPYFYCQGNKYATVGEVSCGQTTNQSSDVRVSDNKVPISSDVIAPSNEYIDMTSHARAAQARVEEIERKLGVAAGAELRPMYQGQDPESEYMEMNRPQSAVVEENV